MNNADKIALLDKFVTAWNAHDVDALMACMIDDDSCAFYSAMGPTPQGGVTEGREAVKASYEAIFKKFPDARWHNLTHFVSGDRGVSQWLFTGTPADGKEKIQVRGCDIFEFKNKKIKVKDTYRKQVI
jgi:hypothetical protein